MKNAKKTAKGRDNSITFKKGKLLLSAAAGGQLPAWVDVYEYGSLMALVSAPEGALHVINNSSRCTRKDISCQSLYGYLMDKYNMSEGGRLSAWYDGEGCLLFGRPETTDEIQRGFHAGFQKVTLPIKQFEMCTVFIDHGVLMVSSVAAKYLPKRVSLYERGAVLCLAQDPEGELESQGYSHGARGIASRELTQYVREKFHSQTIRLVGRICQDQFYFSEKLPEKDQDFTQFQFRPCAMSGPQIWVTMMRNGALHISALASRGLMDWCDVREYGDVLAIVPDDLGKHILLSRKQNQSGTTICKKALCRNIQKKFSCPEGMRFDTRICGGAVCFSNRPLPEELDMTRFTHSMVEEHMLQFASVSPQNIYLCRRVKGALKGTFSVGRYQNVFAFLEDPAGQFHVDVKTQMIVSTTLSGYLQRELGITGRNRLIARPFRGGVLLSNEAFDEKQMPYPTQFPRVTERALSGVSRIGKRSSRPHENDRLAELQAL